MLEYMACHSVLAQQNKPCSTLTSMSAPASAPSTAVTDMEVDESSIGRMLVALQAICNANAGFFDVHNRVPTIG